ncbi:hypothetical protein JCM11251_007351 [Rhodosporidiobolus azoricus]
MSGPLDERRRSNSLELDYGDEDIDISLADAPPHPSPQPALAVKLEDGTDGARQYSQQSGAGIVGGAIMGSLNGGGGAAQGGSRAGSIEASRTSSGLPANPLTGVRPPVASASSGNVPQSQLYAQTAVYIGELHWWTSDADIVDLARLAGVEIPLKNVSFQEHKVNGKSKGVCFIETGSTEKAAQIKNYVDANEYQMKKMTASLTPGGGISPFKTLPKEPSRPQNQPYSSSNPSGSQPSRPGQGIHSRPPSASTNAYINPHPQQGYNQGRGDGGRNNQMGGGMQQRGNNMMGTSGMNGGMNSGMNGGMGQQRQYQPMPQKPYQPQPQQQQQNLGAVNPAFSAAAAGGVVNPAFSGAMAGMPNMMGGFDFTGMGNFGMGAMGGMGGMGNFGMGGLGGMGMPGFGGMGGMGMDFGAMTGMMPGMGGVGMGGVSPLGGAGGGATGGQEGAARKRTRMDG